jgi:hypothetical protein
VEEEDTEKENVERDEGERKLKEKLDENVTRKGETRRRRKSEKKWKWRKVWKKGEKEIRRKIGKGRM